MLRQIDNSITPQNANTNNQSNPNTIDKSLDYKILAATFNSIGDAVVATDTNSHVTRLNQTAEKLTGWKQAEAIGRPVDEIFYIINAETRQPVISPVLETLAQGITLKLPSRALLVSHDGREYAIDCSCAPIINLNNAVEGAVIIFRDITEQESMQTVLQKSEELFRATFENASVGIAHVAHDGQLLRINKQFSCMVGYSIAELLFNKYQKITHPDDLDENIAGYERMLAGDIDSFSMEKRYIRKDKSIFWADLEVGCVRNANHEIDYFIAVVDDITARKQAIEDSRHFFTLSQELLCTVGADGYFKNLNNAWEKTLGYTIKELLAKPYITFVHPDDHEMTLYEAQKLPTGHTTNAFENRYCCKNGAVRWLLWSVVAIAEDQLFYCSARDITERKKIEHDLKIRNEQFEQLINAAPFGIHLVDQDFRIVQINPYALPVCGNTPDLIGRDFGEVMHMIWPTDKANEVIKTYKHTLETGESSAVKEMIEQRVDNKAFGCYAWEIHRIPLPSGKLGVVCYFQDISQRVLAEHKIRDSEWRLRYATESAQLTFVEIDLATGVAYTPENFVNVMGYVSPIEQETNGSIGVQALLEHVVPDDRLTVQTALKQFFNGQPIGKIDYRVLGDDHIERWIESKWSVELGQDGQPSKSFATNLNITERKSVEMQLLVSQQQLSLIAQTVPVFILHLDTQFRILFTNDHYLKRLNKSKEEVFGQRLSDILGEANFDKISHYLNNTLHGEQQTYEVRINYHTMGERDMLVKHMPVKDNLNQVKGIVSIVEDITNNKQQQNALLASEERYRTLFSCMDEGYCVIEMIFDSQHKPIDYRFLEVNLPFEEQSGLVNVIGKSILELFPDFDPIPIAMYGQVATTGEPIRFEYEVKELNRWLDIYAFRINSLDINKIAVLFTNITARKQGEKALIESEERLQAFVASSSDMIYSMSPDWLRMHQLEGKSFVKESEKSNTNWLQDYIYPDDQLAVLAKIKQAIETKSIFEMEHRVLQPDNSLGWTFSRAVPLFNSEGDITEWFGTATDVTERKLEQTTLRQVQETLTSNNLQLQAAKSIAEKANLAKSEFLSSMSHELRTPLNAVLGFAQLIESGATPLTPSQTHNIQQIVQAGWYLLELINEILDLAQIESGQQSILIEAVSINEVMRECATMIEPLAVKHNISITFNALADNAVVSADKTRLKQIMINLLSNALKYNKVGGTVIIDYALIQNVLRICVQDTGSGLNEEELAQLFQPFNRLGQHASLEEGTGIGLVVCKRLIELMHGKIGVQSTVNEGSEFWIELDLIDQIAQEPLTKKPMSNAHVQTSTSRISANIN